MKFIKGMVIGGIATMGVVMMYNEMPSRSKKQMIKKGRQIAKKIGIM